MVNWRMHKFGSVEDADNQCLYKWLTTHYPWERHRSVIGFNQDDWAPLQCPFVEPVHFVCIRGEQQVWRPLF